MRKLNEREINRIDAGMVFEYFALLVDEIADVKPWPANSFIYEGSMGTRVISIDDGCLSYDIHYVIRQQGTEFVERVFTAVLEDTNYGNPDRSLGYKGGTLTVSEIGGSYSGYTTGMTAFDHARVLARITNRYVNEIQIERLQNQIDNS
ncbi:MAG: hypothetical protein WCJ64_01430 [Rhodospirillaceae bacterium]